MERSDTKLYKKKNSNNNIFSDIVLYVFSIIWESAHYNNRCICPITRYHP